MARMSSIASLLSQFPPYGRVPTSYERLGSDVDRVCRPLGHTMRIRVSTLPPLSLTKVWSSLSSLPSAATVSDLKHSLCIQVPALKGLRSDQIQLFVDDFELLDTLSVDVVHENDHVQYANFLSGPCAAVFTPIKVSNEFILAFRLQVRCSKTFRIFTGLQIVCSAQEEETFGFDHPVIFVFVVFIGFVIFVVLVLFIVFI